MSVTITKDPTTNLLNLRELSWQMFLWQQRWSILFLDCSFLLAGKSWSGHGYKSRSKPERKAALFLIAIVSINTAGRVKITDQVAKVHERLQST